ncbi:PaaI family thioesterase [Alkanindiges sp. WGS2144]|uniref:PaaI family thioesterase n=1 Tax=Alkanindiges sp. WGS2144 TaxID=3366808 RepID=UPI0037517063
MSSQAQHITQLISQSVPLSDMQGFYVSDINLPAVRCILPFKPSQTRHGNTISGPILMALSDAAMYALMLALDEQNLNSVTRDLQIHFLSRPAPQELQAMAYLVKDSKKYTLMRVELLSGEKLVAHVTGSYAKGYIN